MTCARAPPCRMGPTPHSTWLTFEVDFAFKSPLYRQVACIFFEEVRCGLHSVLCIAVLYGGACVVVSQVSCGCAALPGN